MNTIISQEKKRVLVKIENRVVNISSFLYIKKNGDDAYESLEVKDINTLEEKLNSHMFFDVYSDEISGEVLNMIKNGESEKVLKII